MQPILNIDDVIVVKKCDIRELKKNDIITFTKEERTISHRIVKIIEREKDRVFITQGDNNEITDDGYVKDVQIYGKVIFNIPKIGKIVEYIQNKAGFIRIAVLVIIIFILISMKDEKRNRRKMVRKKYEIKKEREKYN
ncbi:MAG: signal peptidase I [Clostridia bacterium]|nr:signal peptidase I [Clostridia bacterium]